MTLEKKQIFQGIGVVRGNLLTLEDGEKKTFYIEIEGKRYILKFDYSPKGIQSKNALLSFVRKQGSAVRLVVYPKITHFPPRDKKHEICFQYVAFDKGEKNGISGVLEDFEFKLCGLWQHIPVCQQPCISVFKNFDKEVWRGIKENEAWKQASFMKPSHAPIIWDTPLVKPFRFNRLESKDAQGGKYFVAIKAKFCPKKDNFIYHEVLDEPTLESPPFFKASKNLKNQAMKEKATLSAKGKSNFQAQIQSLGEPSKPFVLPRKPSSRAAVPMPIKKNSCTTELRSAGISTSTNAI